MSDESNLSNSTDDISDQNECSNITCFFCGISSSDKISLQKCEDCNLVWYCGPRHAKLHRPKNSCYPVKVTRHPIKGNFKCVLVPKHIFYNQYYPISQKSSYDEQD